MSSLTTFEVIPLPTLVERVREMRAANARLVQIGATTFPDQIELNYSFDCQGTLQNLRVFVPRDAAVVPSISAIYWCAFIYENEIHDLFGVRVDDMAIDFHGQFYQTAVKYPFGSRRAPAAPATASTASPASPAARADAAPAPAGNGQAFAV